MRRLLRSALLIGALVIGVLASPTIASATSNAGNHTYYIEPNSHLEWVTTTSTTTKTSFIIKYDLCPPVSTECQVGHGSITRGSSAWTLTICDDKADGIGPFIDRSDGGSYGTSGAGHCSSVVAVPPLWRVRWGATDHTPWFTNP